MSGMKGRDLEREIAAAAQTRGGQPASDDREPEAIPADDLEAVRDGIDQARRGQFASRDRIRNVIVRLRS